MRELWARADREERESAALKEQAESKGDLVEAAKYGTAAQAAAEQKRHLEAGLWEVQGFMGEPRDEGLGRKHAPLQKGRQ
jgi:hypothetical protein